MAASDATDNTQSLFVCPPHRQDAIGAATCWGATFLFFLLFCLEIWACPVQQSLGAVVCRMEPDAGAPPNKPVVSSTVMKTTKTRLLGAPFSAQYSTITAKNCRTMSRSINVVACETFFTVGLALALVAVGAMASVALTPANLWLNATTLTNITDAWPLSPCSQGYACICPTRTCMHGSCMRHSYFLPIAT